MESSGKCPIFVSFVHSTTYPEVHHYLSKFGKFTNFDDENTLSLPGCIIFGDVRKIYPPVRLANGNFNCVFIMEQANHLSAPHDQFRVILRLNSPDPLKELTVGSFLAVYNPRWFTAAKMKSFCSGPEGVVVWFSKSQCPISKTKDVEMLMADPISTASSPRSLGVKFLQHSLPVDTSGTHRPGGRNDRLNMPPPSSWIDMRRNQRLAGSAMDHGDFKESCVAARDGCSSSSRSTRKRSHHPKTCSNRSAYSHHSSCLHHSNNHCLPIRTNHHCCIPHQDQACCSVSCQPQVSCSAHRQPPNCHGSSHHTCGCSCSRTGHDACHLSGGGCSLHRSCCSKLPKCCSSAPCGFSSKEKVDHECHNKSCGKMYSTSPEGSQWFVKHWLDKSETKLAQEKPHFGGNDQIMDSEPLTGRATYGGSVIDDQYLPDDDNLTSISQILPTTEPAPGPSTVCAQQRSKTVASPSDGSSDSSLSDTSTLFLKRVNSIPPAKLLPRIENVSSNVKEPHISGSSLIISSEEMVDSVELRKDVEAGKSVSLGAQFNHVTNKLPDRVVPLSDGGGRLSPDTQPTDESQNTCPMVFSEPQTSPAKRPGCSSSPDAEDLTGPVRTKRKLFHPSNSSWYFDSAQRGPTVPCHVEDDIDSNIKQCQSTDKSATGVTESSDVNNVIKSVAGTEVSNTEENEKKRKAVELICQESFGIVPPSQRESKPTSYRKEGANIICDTLSGHKPSKKARSEATFENDCMAGKLVEGIIEELSSDTNIARSETPLLKPADNGLKDVIDEQHPIIRNNAGVGSVEESSPDETQAECSEKPAGSQTSALLNKEPSGSDDIPVLTDHPSSLRATSASEQQQNVTNNTNKVFHHTQLSPDDSIFPNETVLDAEMSLTSCEQTVNVTNNELRPSDLMSLTLCHSHLEVDDQTPTEVSGKKNPSALSELSSPLFGNTSKVDEPNGNHTNRISETENFSPELGPVTIEAPVTVHAVEGRSDALQAVVVMQQRSESTTDGLSEERAQEEIARRSSPASTVFYDAENDDSSGQGCLEGLITRKVSIPNHQFEVEGAIVDIAPHIKEDTLPSIVEGVCRHGCQSRFKHDEIRQYPVVLRACKACASRSHHTCPTCQTSGLQKRLCLEYAFELHVLIGDIVLRLQVDHQEAVRLLGIQIKEFLRKGRRTLNILQQLTLCTDPKEKGHRLVGLIHVKTEVRQNKVVPLLVNTRLKDFKISRNPL